MFKIDLDQVHSLLLICFSAQRGGGRLVSLPSSYANTNLPFDSIGSNIHYLGAQFMTTNSVTDSATVFDLLGNRRRLIVIKYLSLLEQKASVEVRHLARIVRGIELGVPPRQVASDDYESAYNGLIQTHLPKLAAYDIVEYDDARKTVSPTYRVGQYALLAQIARYLR